MYQFIVIKNFRKSSTPENKWLANTIKNNQIVKYEYNDFENIKCIENVYSATLMGGKAKVTLKFICPVELFVIEVKRYSSRYHVSFSI